MKANSLFSKQLDNQYIHYTILTAVCFFSFFIHNEIIPADLMESRNLATAQEMVKYHNYLVPTLNGELRLEKPPLPTWIAAGIEHLFPDNLPVQRGVAGLSASLMVLFLYLSVIRLTRNKSVGLISALVLATCFNVILMGRTATWDIFCHSFMSGACYFLIIGLQKSGSSRKEFILAGIFAGLSFLSKGPVSFYALLLPFILSYAFVFRPSLKEKKGSLILMIGICLVVSFWWNLYILIFHSDAALSVAHKESSSWFNHNVRPWYYYWQFPAEAGIWALFLVTSIVVYFTSRKKAFQKEYTFFLLWLAGSLLLLSLIPEKKTRYLLPISVPGAGLISLYLFRCIQGLTGAKDRIPFQINGGIIALILLFLPGVLYIIFQKEGTVSYPTLIGTGLLSWGLCLCLTRSLFGKKIRVGTGIAAIILSMIMVTGLLPGAAAQLFLNDQRTGMRALRYREKIKDLPFFHHNEDGLRMETVYETNQIIRPLDPNNAAFVQDQAPFVFLSVRPIDSVFLNRSVQIEPLGIFDNNWRKPGHKRYNKNLVLEAAVIKTK